MSLKTRLAGLVGLAFLALAGLGPLLSLWMIATMVVDGATGARLMGVLVGVGLFVSCGLTGYYIRKAVAREVIPVDFDTSAAYRGGQGGL